MKAELPDPRTSTLQIGYMLEALFPVAVWEVGLGVWGGGGLICPSQGFARALGSSLAIGVVVIIVVQSDRALQEVVHPLLHVSAVLKRARQMAFAERNPPKGSDARTAFRMPVVHTHSPTTTLP